jgi:hypothetical protein
MTATDVAIVALYVGIFGALGTVLIIAARWIERRAMRHEYADTLPTAAAVAATEADLPKMGEPADDDVVDAWLDESMALLDDALEHLKRLRRAA